VSITEQAVAVPVGTWTIDPVHSHVEFAVKHLGFATVKGFVPRFTGSLVGGAEPRLEGTLELASVTTNAPDRDEHLRSPDFFDVEQYPEGRLESTRIAVDGDTLRIDAELTLRGETRTVEFMGTLTGEAEDPWGNQRIGLDLEGTIDRSDWGISFNAPLPGGGLLLGNDIALTASFSLIKES
jgi:polyisoprenoid-binding protein YceI